LAKVRIHEQRINVENESSILQLNQITIGKKQLAVELRQIIDTVKHLDYVQKETSNELSRVQNAYDAKMTDLTGSGQLARYK
jgi:hypothetical protein